MLPLADQLGPLEHQPSQAIPQLVKSFKVLTYVTNELAYNPGGRNQGFMYWLAWFAHNADSFLATSDANGPAWRALLLTSCTSLKSFAFGPLIETLLGTNFGCPDPAVVTQAPKRTAMLAALAFTLSCVGLIIFVCTQFGGTIPFSAQGYRLKALFKETGLLVPNADVRISGVTIGKVSAVQNRGLNSLVTMQIDPQYAPIPGRHPGDPASEDAAGGGLRRALDRYRERAEVRRRRHDPDAPGPGHAGARSGARGIRQTDPAEPPGAAQRDRVSLAGRGQTLNDAFGNFDPPVTELSAMVGVLNEQGANLQRLISSGAVVLNTLGARGHDLQTLVTAGDKVFATTAGRNSGLTATVNAMPPFLRQLRTTLTTLDGTLAIAGPTLHALRPVAPLLDAGAAGRGQARRPARRLLAPAPALLSAANGALPAIKRFTTAFHPAVDAILPAAQEVVPIINFIAVYRRELVAAMANLGAPSRAPPPPTRPAGRRPTCARSSGLGRESIFGQTHPGADQPHQHVLRAGRALERRPAAG